MSLFAAIEPNGTALPGAAPRRTKGPWLLAVMFAIAAAFSGILLTGVSGWFLGAVALAGLGPAALTFNFHTPAAFVRLFAVSRTACKFAERIAGHRAALLDQVRRRTGLFVAMAAAPIARAASWQLGNQDRLSDYVDDVEDVDYARLRVGMPALVTLVAIAALATATAWLDDLALVPILAALLAVTVLFRSVLSRATQQWAAARSLQRSAGRFLGAALAAIVPLKAERSFGNVTAMGFAEFTGAAAAQFAQRRAFAVLDMAAGLVGPLATLAVLAAAWHAGSRADTLLVPAFLAFSWLAFGETAGSLSRLMLGRVRERVARQGLESWRAVPNTAAVSSLSLATPRILTLTNIPHQTPDGRSLGAALSLTFEAGRPTALTGASGAGKTTLLKRIAGWIGTDDDGQFAGDGVVLAATRRRALSHLSLHDAAILSDTVRENLFAPGASDAECWNALAAVELDARIATAGGLSGWIDQDMLSLGEAQRLNLARALLSTAPLVLLDEPVEHLDNEQARRVLDHVLSRLIGRIVIYSSHDAHDTGQDRHFALHSPG
jgi:ABC-type transport system involved in cytochrome bd biosynthesis fused ATPase/permease subunit